MFFPRLRHKATLAFALLCATGSLGHAGAWLAPPGEGQIITSASFSDTTRLFDANGKLIPVSAYRKFELGTYIEYGATDWLTVVATPSLDHIEQAASPGYTQSTTGVGDTAIGARARIYQGSNAVFSVQGLLRPPLGLQADSASQFFNHSSQWTGEVRGLAGYSMQIGGLDGFADLEFGYRWNDAATPNEWHADATLGQHVTQELLLMVQNFATISDGRTALEPSYFWDKGQVSGVYAFSPKWAGQIGGFVTLAGKNAGREMGPVAALWYRF